MEEANTHPLVLKADEQYANASLTHALDLYREAEQAEPENPWIHNRIGAILAQMGELEAAEAALNRALQFDPKLAQAHSNIGNLYYARGQYEEALKKYQDAALLNPDSPVFQENLHAAYKKLGKLSEAVTALKRSHKLNREASRSEAKAQVANIRSGLKGKLGCLTLPVTLLIVGTLIGVLL